MQKGNIGVTTENIFPVIKKFLYSDHEIFLREMISNAVDATQKMKTLADRGDYKGELGDLTVRVALDEKAKTLTISDRGIGMTAEEIDKYINQIAFSGVTDFLEKYKDNANNIIGHFGLGFYSSFMVSKKVEIITKSYKEDAKAVKWSCDGSPAYEIDDAERAEHGSDIILYIDDDCKEFLDKYKLEGLLQKYCKFMAVPIAFGKKTEWKDGKQVDTEEDNIINNVEPLWTKAPSTLKDEDYKSFYRTLYPMSDEPLFWIHLNVDYPFNLTGILYFPKIKSNIELQKNKIQLYCNQVFVTDQVEGIVPEFLTLLHGVIDSPDIPLNVSRSYLQSDREVKKISTYITKKVADKLAELFKADRENFEKKWDDVKMFIQFGMLTDEKFYEKAIGFALLKNLDGKYFTLDEYKAKVKEAQTDKDGNLVLLYAQDPDASYSYIQRAKEKGYDVLLMNGELDVHAMSQFEQKAEDYKLRFVRVDSDIIENIIKKEEATKDNYTAEQKEGLRKAFESILPEGEKLKYTVTCEAASADALPVFITQNEFMRRMKDMAAHQQGLSFYGQMPDSYTLVLNTNHPLIQALVAKMTEEQVEEKVEKKEENPTSNSESGPTSNNEVVLKTVYRLDGEDERLHQLTDIALLASGLLKGEALAKFVNRSVELL